MLKDVCSKLKKHVKLLEKNKQKLAHLNKILISEKLEIEEKTLTLCQELDQVKDFMNIREKEFLKLESESLDLKCRLDSLVSENNKLHEKVQRAESDLVQNRCWNMSLAALNWLNTHRSRNKMGLGFVNQHVYKLVNEKYAGLQENIICFHCGKKDHYRYTCPLRKNAMERSMLYVNKYGLVKMRFACQRE